MPPGIFERLPDLSLLTTGRDSAGGQIAVLQGAFSTLSPDDPDSPLARITGAIGDLDATLDIDLSGLAEQLPAAIETVRNALPADSLTYIESIETAYETASNFLSGGPLSQAATSGESLQAVALAVVEEAMQLFGSRLDDLTENLVDPQLLQQVRDALSAVEAFRTDFPAHSDEFLPFIARNLLGVAPDLLEEPLGQLEASFSAVATLEPAVLATALDTPRQALAAAFDGLVGALEGLDPADAADYQIILQRLQAAESAINGLTGALSSLYEPIGDAIDAPIWDTLFQTYRTLLEAVPLQQVISVDDIVDQMADLLENILAGLFTTFGVEDLAARLEAMSATIRDNVVGSALGQIRQTLIDALGDVREAIEGVPTEEIQATVEAMLGRIKEELDALGIAQIGETIEQAFEDVETFITTNINDALRDEVRDALTAIGDQAEELDLGGLIQQITDAVGQIEVLIGDLHAEVEARMGDLRDLVSQLEELSFEPISDEVIEEIDEVTTRLEAIEPNALSDLERLAIKAALAVLEAIDLERQVVDGLKLGFATAQGEFKSLLDDLAAELERLTGTLDAFSPRAILGVLEAPLDEAGEVILSVDGRRLLDPLYEQVDVLAGRLAALSPGGLLDPLQAPYNEMMAAVGRLDPAQWTAPLNDLYAQIDRLIDFVDVTPLLEELDRRQRELFANARQAILDAIDGLDLPEPLSTFFDQLRPTLEAMTDAIFGDPGTELPSLSTDLAAQFRPTSLFAPLDLAFDELMELIESVPAAPLTETLNAVREGVGLGLLRLDPGDAIDQLRAAQERLAGLAPPVLLGTPLSLPRLKLIFEARAEVAPPERQGDVLAVSARFDAVASLVTSPAPTQPFVQLTQRHNELLNALRRRINGLDVSGAEEAYANLRQNLDRLIPDFLRQAAPLTHADILAGLATMRPSTRAAKVDRVVERFLREVQPLQDALASTTEGFFDSIREVMQLINPLSLREAVAEIYDALRAKVRILDPDELAAAIREDVFEPLLAPLEAIDPARLKQQLNEVFESAVTAVTTRLTEFLDDVVAVIDEVIAPIRLALQGLLDQVRQAIETTSQRIEDVLAGLEQLIVHDLLEGLTRMADNLGLSFDRELDRVVNAFNAMLAAIPLGDDGGSAGAGVTAVAA